MELSSLKSIEEYPKISFMGDYTMEKLADDMVSWFKEKHKELCWVRQMTGESFFLLGLILFFRDICTWMMPVRWDF